MVFLPLFVELRKRNVKVGFGEAMALAHALALGLHESCLDGFYRVARALCVHSESDLDAFDEAFRACFHGVERESLDLVGKVEAWLRQPHPRPSLSPEEYDQLEPIDWAELRRQFEERLREQTERHDGGSRWIGTGGTSPFGSNGVHPSGIRVGPQGGGRSATAVADARAYLPYRGDLVLDVRQMGVALRKLRALARQGAELELDLDATISETTRNGGELEVILRPRKKPNVNVLLLMDVGGSMDPHTELVSQLFSAAKRASNFRKLETYYFHNCVYRTVYRAESMREPALVRDLLERCTRDWKLVLVGDAAMHPAELFGQEWLASGAESTMTGLQWMQLLADHYDRSAWLNPDPPRFWKGGTAEMLSHMFPMFPLTLDGLGDAMAHLSRSTRSAAPP
jgi:uncharacterized protein with von Willebrand factor type A (vWA) domain